MSVTFTTTPDHIDSHALHCSCMFDNPAAGTHHATYEAADNARRNHITNGTNLPGCTNRCAQGDLWIEPQATTPVPDVNLSNHNAAMILDLLGQDATELCGSMDATQLVGAILLAHALTPTDQGVPAYADGNVINCGRRPGYTEETLNRLATLATYARQHDGTVTWA